MPRKRQSDDDLLTIVAGMLENEGYDAVQLREVARRAQMSLATIYKQYPTRDDLITAALERWMDDNRYAGLAEFGDVPAGESLHEGLMRVYRAIFEPWERHPRMLQAYSLARVGPMRERFWQQGLEVVGPAMRAVLDGVDPDFDADLSLTTSNLIYALMGRFADGEIDSAEILTTLDRVLARLCRGYELERRRPR